MHNEHVDPVYKYIDGKIKPIKRELQKLNRTILLIQQLVASLKINADTDNFHSILTTELPKKNHLVTQLFTDAATAKARITSSNTPLNIAVEFFDNWAEILKKSGAKMITY